MILKEETKETLYEDMNNNYIVFFSDYRTFIKDVKARLTSQYTTWIKNSKRNHYQHSYIN